MASAGMLHRGRNTGPESGDEVQRSLELLDSVLSEFEEGDRVSVGGSVVVEVPSGGAIGGVTTASVTPDDDSPSLGGHQSEDDGYMSMNGRRTKFALSFRPTEEKGEPIVTSECPTIDISPSNVSVAKTISLESETNEESLSPPPPSEAERIICTLLPKVSPSNTSKKNIISLESDGSPTQDENNINNEKATHISTQTTLPKTRHQRPYGWDKDDNVVANAPSHVQCKFSSLQHGPHPPIKINIRSFASPSRQKNGEKSNNSTPTKKSPGSETPKAVFPLTSSFNYENNFASGNMPYNEHPVTIYPGANVPYTKQLNSPTYGLPKGSPLSTSYTGRSSVNAPELKMQAKKENKSDGESLSPANKVPPRTLAGSIERHREVCRRSNKPLSPTSKKQSTDTDGDDEEEHFSDDSLEESLPPPPPPTALTPSKRSSIAWEVSFDGDDPLLTPGSTKVVGGRRRRKSGDQSNSSTSSIPQKVEEWISETQGDYWPPPPMQCSTEDEIASPFSDTSDNVPIPENITEIHGTGTYVIRRGKKDRKNIPHFDKKPQKSTSKCVQLGENEVIHKGLDGDHSVGGSSLSISGISTSGSHNSVSSLNSRLSSDLSIPNSRYSIDFNSRYSRELTTPNSRFSIDLCIPQSNNLKKELSSPKSRLSLDLNNSQDKYMGKDFFNGSPRNKKLDGKKFDINICNVNKTTTVPNKLSPQNRFMDFKKYSCTFDNIQSLMKEGVETSICGPQFDETSNDLEIVQPSVVRVVSLPTLNAETDPPGVRQILTTTMEEEEELESPSQSSEDNSPLKKIENNISALLNQGRDQQFNQYLQKDWDIHKDEFCDNNSSDSNILPINGTSFNSNEKRKRNEIQKSSSHNEIPNKRLLDFHRDKPKRNGIHKSSSSKDMPMSINRQMSSSDSTCSSGGDFPIHVQMVEHAFKPHLHDFGPLPNSPGSPQFPPLPPSPVQEDDEYSEILQPLEKMHLTKPKESPLQNIDLYHRSLEAPIVPPHRDLTTNSLKTRSMDTSFCKNRRNNNANKSMSADRRTLPSDMGMMSGRRRTLQRQRGRDDGSGSSGLQTSASLPETPVFGRGVDVPRTPHRRTADGPRISSTMNSIQTMSGSCTVGGYGRAGGTGSMERALASAELIRLAGGPARGWYPKQRHRPASIEHLERLPHSTSSNNQANPWDSSRKPLTLPPNLTPKFFQKSPREALRRVTSLLIRKGNGSKDSSKKERQAVSPAARSANGEETAQKQRKGFFKSFWKRSRHYSLEHP